MLEKPLVGGTPGSLLIHEFDLHTRSYTGVRYLYPLEPLGVSIGEFQMFDSKHGVVIERDDFMGTAAAFKAVYEIELQGPGNSVRKTLAVDLLNIKDPHGISAGDRLYEQALSFYGIDGAQTALLTAVSS